MPETSDKPDKETGILEQSMSVECSNKSRVEGPVQNRVCAGTQISQQCAMLQMQHKLPKLNTSRCVASITFVGHP